MYLDIDLKTGMAYSSRYKCIAPSSKSSAPVIQWIIIIITTKSK